MKHLTIKMRSAALLALALYYGVLFLLKDKLGIF